jgi:hypothetical protein
MATDVDTDVAIALQTALVGNFNGAGQKTLFAGPMRAERKDPAVAGSYLIPPAALFVLETGGPPQQAYCGDNTRVVAVTVVQIMVRGDDDAFDVWQAKARAAIFALHQKPPAGYIDARVREDRPNYLGKDGSDRHLWSINVEMTHVRTI